MVRLRSDYSVDFISCNLDGGVDEVESQVHVGPFPSHDGLKIVACDEASGRLLFPRARSYILLYV